MKQRCLWVNWTQFTLTAGDSKCNGWHRMCNDIAIFQTF